jgi:hypothetical protein
METQGEDREEENAGNVSVIFWNIPCTVLHSPCTVFAQSMHSIAQSIREYSRT